MAHHACFSSGNVRQGALGSWEWVMCGDPGQMLSSEFQLLWNVGGSLFIFTCISRNCGFLIPQEGMLIVCALWCSGRVHGKCVSHLA